MLKNAYLVAKIGADTAAIKQHFAEILPNSSDILPKLVRICSTVGAATEAMVAEPARSGAPAHIPRTRVALEPQIDVWRAEEIRSVSNFCCKFLAGLFSKNSAKFGKFCENLQKNGKIFCNF